MLKSKSFKITVAVVAVVGFISFARYRTVHKPADHTEEDVHTGTNTGQGQTLEVAFLPVTCHLTCPVTDFASKTSVTGTRFDALRFGEFPSMVEALKSSRLMAAFLTVPLAIKMREQGVPIKMVCLGHRDGSQLVIAKDNPAKDMHGLVGKRIAIPSPFSNENFFLNKMIRDQGLKASDFDMVVLPPPEMVSAMASKAIDAFIVAEPFCSKAELDGVGRVLYYAKQIWPNYISCCLVVREELIRDKKKVVEDLVRGIVDSGEWAETHRKDAATLAATYFRQDPKLLNYVLTQPADRVTYRNLNPTDDEMQKIMDMGMSLGFIKKSIPMNELMDRSFIPTNIVAPNIDMAKLGDMKIPEMPAKKPAK
ncbi:MAG: ABC transporter substrate-binding protein [Chthonomonadales bacterium]